MVVPPAWVFHRTMGPASKPDPAWPPLFTGSQILPGACCSAAGVNRPYPPAPAWSPVWAAGWISAPLYSFMDCRRAICITMVFTMGCRVICSGACIASFPLLFTDLGDCVVVSPIYSHSSLTGAAQWLLPFFKYVFTEVQSTLLTGSALAIGRSVLERGGTGST